MTAPAPHTPYQWTSHCRHCTWRVLTHNGRTVGTFRNITAVQTYIEQHPTGPGSGKH